MNDALTEFVERLRKVRPAIENIGDDPLHALGAMAWWATYAEDAAEMLEKCHGWLDNLDDGEDLRRLDVLNALAAKALGKNAENSTQEHDGDTSKAPKKKQLDTRG